MFGHLPLICLFVIDRKDKFEKHSRKKGIMSQPVSYTSFNEGTSSRRFTGFPLNSTLVSSYTPDTIRSIISQAAAGQPYCMFTFLCYLNEYRY